MLILDHSQMLTERLLGQPQPLHPTLHPVTIGLEDAFRRTDGHAVHPAAPFQHTICAVVSLGLR